MKIFKKPTFWMVTICIIIILGLGIYNIFSNDKFFEISFSTCVSLILAVGVSFYIVQKQTDQRIQKQIFVDLLKSLQNLVDDEQSYLFNDMDSQKILMRKREISNKIVFIKKYSHKFSLEKEIKFLEKMFKEYSVVVGDHISDIDTLKKLHNELKRPLSLISQKLFEIMFDLYN